MFYFIKHFICGYMVLDIWQTTTQIAENDFYMYHSTNRMAFVTSVVEHLQEQEIAQWVPRPNLYIC